MTGGKELRRRGIGWHLLKAIEELISQMRSSKEEYLHCVMIVAAPFNMYTKAGYFQLSTIFQSQLSLALMRNFPLKWTCGNCSIIFQELDSLGLGFSSTSNWVDFRLGGRQSDGSVSSCLYISCFW